MIGLIACVSLLGGSPDPGLIGFSSENLVKQRSLEARFDASLRKDDMRGWLKRLSAKPHHVGSPYGLENAQFALSLFKSWGYDAQIEEFQVLFASPKLRQLELLGPKKFTASLAEPAVEGDATSGIVDGLLPPYNCYSCDGDVTGDLVYVNYGVPADYEVLAGRGVSVKGKIVIARYGGSWRGIKRKVAAEHGAIGCLIYSDPKDDGYGAGDVYPKGGYRNEHGVQRGSVGDMPHYPGDPLTPGVGATKDAKRLALKDVKIITKIPTQPISYADALPLLQSIGGPVAPDGWRGGLPLTYHLGPGSAKAHLRLQFNWDLVTARDVVAKMRGSERPDEWVIRGNHHDGWVFGAEDPLSGAVALLEEAKGVAEATQRGGKLKRTVVYSLWDGEEPGLLGSTEWVETHASELDKVAALYINTDSNGRGFFGGGGSQTLEPLVNEAIRDVKDPETGSSVLDRWKARAVTGGGEDKIRANSGKGVGLDPLGSGSDFSSFLQHAGVASLNVGYGGEGGGGSYHSTYDSFDYFCRFVDPKFDYELALAQTCGRITMRAANADVFPVEFEGLSGYIDKYVAEVSKLADDMRTETADKNRTISDGSLKATFDPSEVHVVPAPKSEVPFLNFAPLQNAAGKLKKAAARYAAVRTRAVDLAPDRQMRLDQALIHCERAFLNDVGLLRRPWYRHQIYAPGFYTGYGVKTLPGVREAIEQRDWAEATSEGPVVAAAIERMAAEVDKATDLIGKK